MAYYNGEHVLFSPKVMLNDNGSSDAGSSETWELISEVKTTEEVNEISFSTDMNGNAFELDEVYVYIEFITESAVCPSIQLLKDDSSGAYLYVDAQTYAPSYITVSRKDGKDLAILDYYYGDTLVTTRVFSTKNDWNVTKFRMQTFDIKLPKNTVVRLYGKRVEQ